MLVAVLKYVLDCLVSQSDLDPGFKLSASYSAENTEHCALTLVECLACSGGRGSTWHNDIRVNMLRERSRNMSHNICPHSQAAWDLWHVSVGSLDYNASWLLSECIWFWNGLSDMRSSFFWRKVEPWVKPIAFRARQLGMFDACLSVWPSSDRIHMDFLSSYADFIIRFLFAISEHFLLDVGLKETSN